jgi:hypothetical protein
VAVPVASDLPRAVCVLGISRWAAGIARAAEYRIELALDHRLDQFAHPIT